MHMNGPSKRRQGATPFCERLQLLTSKFSPAPTGTVRPARINEAGPVKDILGEALGEDYVDLESTRRFINVDDLDTRCLVAVSAENEIIGVLTLAVYRPADFDTAFPIGQEDLVKHLLPAEHVDKVGLVKSIAVTPERRNEGIASQLVVHGIEWAIRETDATVMFAFGWKSREGCHIEGVMRRSGFDPVSEVRGFWTKESIAEGYDCPDCGRVCQCDAVVFRRAIP